MNNEFLKQAEDRWLTYVSSHSNNNEAMQQATMIHLGYVNALYDLEVISYDSYQEARHRIDTLVQRMKWDDLIISTKQSKIR